MHKKYEHLIALYEESTAAWLDRVLHYQMHKHY